MISNHRVEETFTVWDFSKKFQKMPKKETEKYQKGPEQNKCYKIAP